MNLEEKFQGYGLKIKELKRLTSKKEKYVRKSYDSIIYGILSFGALIFGGVASSNLIMFLGAWGCVDNLLNFNKCINRYEKYDKQFSELEKELENGNKISDI